MSRTTYALIAAVLAAVAIPLAVASGAFADEDTQSPLQVLDAGTSLLGTGAGSLLDAANGEDRPSGADGTESEVPVNGNLVDGPVAGLLQNGPFE